MTDRTPSARGDSSSLAHAAEHLRLLVETGLLLAREHSVDVIVQAALDAGLKLSGAAFGAFFYNCFTDHGRHYQLCKISGVDPVEFSRFPMPRPTAIFAESMIHGRILRSADIAADPRYGQNPPYTGMPPGHLPVRSYLSVPLISRSGETLGTIFYGHPEPNVFAPGSESLVATIAAQAAVAMDNARLAENLTSEIAIADAARQLQRETSQRLEQALDDMAESSRRLRQALDAGALGTWSWDMATDRLDLDERAAQLLFAAMLHGIVELFSRKLQFKRLACSTHIQPGLRLYGLQGEIRQVFSNLLVNAIDASENTELTIRACGRMLNGRPGISCLIADRGIGVQPAVRERLFSPFITSKHSLGTGLGLWVTRGIVEKHGGTILYRTRTQEPTGTVFRVFLPTEVPNREIFDAPAQRFLQ